MNKPVPESRRSVRWSLVVLCVAIGLGMLTLAWRLSDPAEPEAFWVGVLVNVGTAILLAAAIFWLERSFVKTARRAVREAASEAATIAATEAAEIATATLTTRLDSLQEQMEQRRSSAKKRESKVLDNLEESTSWQAMFDVMNVATSRGAINHQVTVLAGSAPDAPLVQITVREAGQNEMGQFWESGISLTLEADASPHGGIGIPIVHTYWTADVAPAVALDEFRDDMIRRGFGQLAKAFEAPSLIANLRDGLADAIAGRLVEDGAWRSTGDLYEILGPDWAISRLGVEHRDHGVVLARTAFPSTNRGNPVPGLSANPFEPARPEWVDEEWWRFVVKRGLANRNRAENIFS